jgi:hypothetical protein
MKIRMRCLVLGFVWLLVAVPAVAQDSSKAAPASPAVTPAQEAPNKHARSGFWFNGGLGYGTIGCEDCDGERESGLSGNLTFGGTVSQRFLIGFGTAGFTKSIDGETLSMGHYDARIRFYPSRTNGFFITGGAGLGVVSFAGESETGFSLLFGIGHDIRVSKNVSLTPFWNGFAASVDSSTWNVGQIGIGVTIH